MKKLIYIVTIDAPDDLPLIDARNYVREAVGTWMGQCRPPGSYGPDDEGDPVFRISGKVSVSRATISSCHRLWEKLRG